jgi:hypothetical protein
LTLGTPAYLIRRALLQNLSIFHHYQTIGQEEGFGDIMGDVDKLYSEFCVHPFQFGLNAAVGSLVQGAQGLIE